MPTISWFPLPVYVEKATGTQYGDIQKEITELYNNLSFAQNPQWTSDTSELSLESKDDPFFVKHHLKDCAKFLKFVDSCVINYLKQIGCTEKSYVVENSWLTRTTNNQYIHMHDHGNYDISGVYYVQTNGADGQLFFPSPHRPLAGNHIFSKISDRYESFPLEQGLMALWPSTLYHNTAPNKTKDERISASFNIKIL
tara:strand:+ start:322 stop:912 length:591 start_codon:yes stop_codon:yes gene_type:complete